MREALVIVRSRRCERPRVGASLLDRRRHTILERYTVSDAAFSFVSAGAAVPRPFDAPTGRDGLRYRTIGIVPDGNAALRHRSVTNRRWYGPVAVAAATARRECHERKSDVPMLSRHASTLRGCASGNALLWQ